MNTLSLVSIPLMLTGLAGNIELTDKIPGLIVVNLAISF
jgi:hypothetical protein